jgi:hypothetical protein
LNLHPDELIKLNLLEYFTARVFDFKMLIKKLKNKFSHLKARFLRNKTIFCQIYKSGGFSIGGDPLSGSGATLTQTQSIRDEIPKIMKQLNAKAIIDAPCGDFNWMKEVYLKGYQYIGLDIVEELIQKNNTEYANGERIFLVRDIVKDSIPAADLILSRDCFVHLSNKDILRAIRNFKKSGSLYLLTTTFTRVDKNKDLVSGRGWRPINLERPPFNFHRPLKIINENCTEGDGLYSDKSLALWKISLLPK